MKNTMARSSKKTIHSTFRRSNKDDGKINIDNVDDDILG
jgi:hypothetical protein